MQRVIAIILPILILVVIGFGGHLFLSSLSVEPAAAPERDTRLSVFVEPAISVDFQLSIGAQGTVKPVREISISPQIGGKIDYMNPAFQDGGAIKKGQTLLKLEQDDYRLAVVRARSAVASAEQLLLREKAQSDLARQDLQELGITGASDLALRKPQMAQAQAELNSAKAQLSEAELALSRTILKAPFTGLVNQKMVDVGEFVGPGQSLGRVFDTSVFEIYLPIQDSEFSKIGLDVAFAASPNTPGPEVILRGDVGGQAHSWKGRVVRTSATINAVTRQIGVFVEVKDPYGSAATGGTPLPSGLFVDAVILGEKLENVMLIPRSALRAFDRVYVADDQTGELRIRTVEVAQSDSDTAIVTSGIEEGDLVITSLIDGPTEGRSLRLLKTGQDGEVETIEVTSPSES